MKIKSIKIKLALSYILIILISFGFVAYFLDKNLEENLLQEIKSSLLKDIDLIGNQLIIENLIKEDIIYLDSFSKQLGQKANSRVTIINTQGKVLADSDESLEATAKLENHASRPEVKAALDGEIGEEIRYSTTLKIDMLYIAKPIMYQGATRGVLRLALPLSNVKNTLGIIRRTILLSLFFALGVALVLGSMFAAGIIRPINKIMNISRNFAKGDFKHEILLASNDEIGELAQILNAMAKNLEEKIAQVQLQNQQSKAILESMIEGIVVVDSSNKIISLNSSAEKIFSITKESSKDKNFLEVIRNNDIEEIIKTALQNGKFISKELYLVWPLKKVFEINAIPIFENKTPSACLLVIHDITEARKLETVRKDFVANVSHELKTPLTSIKGFIETLLDGALEDKVNSRNFLKVIQEHANRLDNLVNDLLKLSYLESKEVILQKEDTNIRNLSKQVLDSFKSQLKNIKLNNELPANLSLKIDKNKIEQVLTNLIDNAIKFNREKGTINIRHEDLPDKIKIVIEDSGIGIPVKDIPRIFERFYRVDKARSSQLGGTGLGLSIVKHIIELHDGNVGVESTEGFGSKFFFYLPK